MITRKLFDRLFPVKGLDPRKYNLVRERDLLISALNRILPKYGITNYLRICAYFANCGIETDYFKTTIEYASGKAYDPRTDLGNTKAIDGDGEKYKGRGLSQTTGRFNYLRVVVRFVKKLIGVDLSNDEAKLLEEADRLGVNFIAHPEKLAEIEYAVESACIYWDEHDLNSYAEAGDFRGLSGIVNRGNKKLLPLHWPKRLALYKQCLKVIPKDIDLSATEEPATAQPLVDVPAPAVSTDTAQANAGGSMSLQAFSNKYLRHAPADKVKNILLVISGRIGTGLGLVWNLGVGGKFLAALLVLIVLGPLVYAIYVYRWRIVGWAQTIADPIFGNS